MNSGTDMVVHESRDGHYSCTVDEWSCDGPPPNDVRYGRTVTVYRRVVLAMKLFRQRFSWKKRLLTCDYHVHR
jgi:hypothetical protein